MLYTTLRGPADVEVAFQNLRARVNTVRSQVVAKEARLNQFLKQQGSDTTLGFHFVPFGSRFGYKTTGEVLTAMKTVRSMIEDLDLQIMGAACTLDTTSPEAKAAKNIGIPFLAKDCDPRTAQFRAAWSGKFQEIYDWYLANIDFWSRFVDTGEIYDQAVRYADEINSWRTEASKQGLVIAGLPTKIEPRTDVFDSAGNVFSGLLTFAKWMVGVAVVMVVAPPVIRAGADFVKRRRDEGVSRPKRA